LRQSRELVEEAERLRRQGKFDRAESICYPLVRRHPKYLAALHTLGLIYLDKRNFERALDCLIRASMLDPTNWMTLSALSLAYLRLGASEMAAQTLNRALAIRPQEASIFSLLGEIHREEREYALAIQAYRQALSFGPTTETPVAGLALCLSALGQSAEAARVLGEAYDRGVRTLRLLHIMTTLPAGTVSIDILEALSRLASVQTMTDAATNNTYLFANAAALDAAGRYEEAWDAAVKANRPLAAEYRAELKAEIERRESSLARLRAVSTAHQGPIPQQPISLFILGPSRSGKTTLERLVSSLDHVKIGSEAPIVEKAVRRTFQTAAIPTSSRLENLPAELLPSFRDMYLEGLAQRVGTARVFTNTLPGHIHNAALLANVIPNVRFLLVKRNLDDVTWRIYLTKYLSGNAYAYDLRAILDYLEWYNTMIELTAEKLPDVTRIVSYEAITSDPATILHGAAEFCGLEVGERPMSPLPSDHGCSAHYVQFLR